MAEKTIVLNKERKVTLTSFICHKKETPAILILPGGAYNECSINEGRPVAEKFNSLGFNCFVLYYSLGEKAEFPRPLQDVSLAIAHIKRHAAEYNVDPERIFVCGFSAGGHLAASAGVFWNDKEAAFEGMEPGENKPAGMVLCYGVLSLCEHTHIESCRYVTGREEPTEAQCTRVGLPISI